MYARLHVGDVRFRARRGLAAGARYLFTLTGQLAYANGSPVVGASVYLHDWPTMTVLQLTTSDANGAYQFITSHNTPCRATFFLAGAPNFFGITDILVPS